jgi:hypothetical protein
MELLNFNHPHRFRLISIFNDEEVDACRQMFQTDGFIGAG